MTDAPMNAGPPRRIRVGDVALNVRVTGEGEPVLLLQVFPDSSAIWREVTPQLVAAGYRVIAFDQRSFGESDAPAGVGNFRIEAIAADIPRGCATWRRSRPAIRWRRWRVEPQFAVVILLSAFAC